MDISSLLFPLLILVLFIPLLLSGRKQKRQVQQMQQLQRSLEPGDVVMTTSGLRGTVVDASYEDTVDIEIADGVVTTWLRAAVREKVLDEVPAAGATAGATTGATAGATAGSTATAGTTADSPADLPSDLTDPPVAERPASTDTNGTAGPRP